MVPFPLTRTGPRRSRVWVSFSSSAVASETWILPGRLVHADANLDRLCRRPVVGVDGFDHAERHVGDALRVVGLRRG